MIADVLAFHRRVDDGPLANAVHHGAIAGAEVAQLYIHQKNPSLPRPEKELKGFKKVFLKPGETQTVSIPLEKNAFAFYDPAQKSWVAEKDDYEIAIGSSSRDMRLQGNLNLQ